MKSTNDTASDLRKKEDARTMARMPRILVAEDDIEMRRLLVTQLHSAGFETIECADGYQLMDHLGNPVLQREPDDFDLIVSDIRMPGASGMDALKGIHEAEWFVPMILITAFGNDDVHRQAEYLGAAAIFDKPFDLDELIAMIRQILVLDSEGGHNWSFWHVPSKDTTTVPVDVVFSHMAESDFIEQNIKHAAQLLETLHKHILYCRTVITGPDDSSSGRYHIQIMVTLSDKVFVVRSNMKEIESESDLTAAIPVAFEVTLGKIRKYLMTKAN